MAVYVNIRKSKAPEGVCLLSLNIMIELGIKPGHKYTLKLGQCITDVTVSPYHTGDSRLMLNMQDCLRLGIPEDMNLGIQVSGSQIQLGPVMGVFVNPWYFRRIGRPSPPGGCKNIMKANEKSHLLIYFFTMRNVNWEEKKAEGWYYSQDKKTWTKNILPRMSHEPSRA